MHYSEEEKDLSIVKAYAEKWGYGRLMQYLSQEWHKKDPEGALSIGPCYGTLRRRNEALDKLIGDYKANDAELIAEDAEILAMVFSERGAEDEPV